MSFYMDLTDTAQVYEGGADALVLDYRGPAATAVADAMDAYATRLREIADAVVAGEMPHPECRKCQGRHW